VTDPDLRQAFLFANRFKEGDLQVGDLPDEKTRVEARQLLEGLTLAEITPKRFVVDGVSDSLARSTHGRSSELKSVTVAEAKRTLLGPDGAAWAGRHGSGLSSEAIAAIVKTMTEAELSVVARKLFNPLPGPGVGIGAAGHFGSRIQPNSPGDDETEILLSILDGLSHGCGDVVLGINPATDDVATIVRLEALLERVVDRLELPTRTSVLSDLVKQDSARSRTRVDVGFQSLAGTTKALTGMVALDVAGILELARGFEGLYFETGQGAEVTNGAHEGVDMVTLEARSYGVARWLQRRTGKWAIVNDVAGFIGPEVFRTPEQLARACLEDSVMGKLHGLTMGLDVCATFHMGIEPEVLRRLTVAIAEQAAPAYLMAVPGNADPMLGYLTTSFREHPRLRAATNRGMTSAMQRRLEELGVIDPASGAVGETAALESLYARYHRAGGDSRSDGLLKQEAAQAISRLRERGWDLGGGSSAEAASRADQRVNALFQNAREALYARIDPAVIRDVCSNVVELRSRSADREDFLAHPLSGEQIDPADAALVKTIYPTDRPRIQVVISDGLNANAINENLRALLPALRAALAERAISVGSSEIVVRNGRVRAGYHLGVLLDVDGIVHLIGERPGTGLNTMSAYLTYGRDRQGRSRWKPGMDHADTSAICGIHERGKNPLLAAAEIARVVARMLEEGRSGVGLGPEPG
jgi:ethanolamine ammonia-lyase large subunit